MLKSTVGRSGDFFNENGRKKGEVEVKKVFSAFFCVGVYKSEGICYNN